MNTTSKYVIIVLTISAGYYFLSDRFDPSAVAGKRVLITGASSGIGEHLAYEYSKLGARVLLVARRAPLLRAVADKCFQLGARQVDIVPGDMGAPEDRIMLMAEVTVRLGGLDHLVLNHAVLRHGWWLGSAENLTRLHEDMDINFMSHVDLASRALCMLAQSGGSIGVVSSVQGIVATVLHAPYVSSKFALQGFFSALRQELAHRGTGVSVTLGVLGLIDTDIAKLNDKQKAFSGYAKYMWSMFPPQGAALAILKGIALREPQIYYGTDAHFLVHAYKVFPRYFEWHCSTLLRFTYEAT